MTRSVLAGSVCLSVTGIVMLGLVALAAAQTEAAQVGPDPTALWVDAGQVFTVTMAITDVVDLYGWQAGVTYDPAYLEYVEVKLGEFMPASGSYFRGPDVSPGRLANIAFTLIGQPRGIDGSGDLFHVVFRALNGTHATDVQLCDVTLVNSDVSPIEMAYINGGICHVAIDWGTFLPLVLHETG